MKKIHLITVLLLMTFVVKGQVNKLSIGLFSSPDAYNYSFNKIPGFDHKYKTRINYSTGLIMQYNLNENFVVRTGLLYSTKGYLLDYAFIFMEPNDPLIPRESNVKLSYCDIPIMVSYNFINDGRLSLYASSGIIGSILINDKEISIMEDDSEKETEFSKVLFNQKFNSTVFAIEFGLGLKYNLNEKVFISLVPYLRYGLNKINNDVLKSNPMSYGIGAGFNFNL
jgi:opacity protein-like surface antigen